MHAVNEPATSAGEPEAGRVQVVFTAPDFFTWLEAADAADLDALAFGLIAIAYDGTVEHYNLAEAAAAGLTPARVIGRNFFTSVAPCTNNFMIAHRFEAEPALDVIMDYVFTFIMAPQKVQLRLLKQPHGRRMYVAVVRI